MVAAHGGRLVDLRADARRAEELRGLSRDWPSWDLNRRQLSDLELLANGGFSPLTGFLERSDYDAVCATARLADGTLWPIPVVLDVSGDLARSLAPGMAVALRDPEGVMVGVVHVADVWEPDRAAEAEAVHGTAPAGQLLERTNPVYVGGRVELVAPPAHHDFVALRLTPAMVRTEFARRGWAQVVAFATNDVMHRAEVELTLAAAARLGANVLIQASVGMDDPADADHYARVRCYQAVLAAYPRPGAMLSLVALAGRGDAARQALWQAVIAQNHGCSHVLGASSDPSADQQLGRQHHDELGVAMVAYRPMVYVPGIDEYVAGDAIPPGTRTLALSGTELRRCLDEGRDLPRWFTYPGVEAELRRRHPPRHQQGVTVFFTGLSGSGKSTIANVLASRFLEEGERPVTLLDGDVVRKHLSSDLGFSKEHRAINIRRIGFVASEITKNGGIAICAPIAPYRAGRDEVRRMVAPAGGFVLVHVDTPLEECEARDRKGLYAKARAGILKEFTGISDPYEVPTDADVVIDTAQLSPEAAAALIIRHLVSEGYVRAGSVGPGRGAATG